jgi:PAS domain-containing protein
VADIARADIGRLGQESVDLRDFVTTWVLIPVTLLAVATLLWSWAQRGQAVRRTQQLQRELNERRRVERALRESEARFRDVTEAASDWIWEMDENLRFTYLSERFYALTGIAPQFVLGRTRWDLAGVDSSRRSTKMAQASGIVGKASAVSRFHLPNPD